MLVPSVFHDGMVVNRENLKLTVISEGYQKEEEIYK
jgi:D-xylose transport system substrate-binding protein